MNIQKTADGFDTLFSDEYGETFHSRHGVLQEAQHVFLEGAGVAKRLKSNQPVSVLEIGFGTGFNFFLTAKMALEFKTEIEFVSFEKNLLSHKTFSELNHGQLFSTNSLRTQFLEWRINKPDKIPRGKYEIDFENDRLIHLSLLVGNALEFSYPENTYEAVYLDAFNPDSNPELWTASFFKQLFFTMKNEALLSTYSAKGSVKRAMQEAGFEVIKKVGSIGKREMLTARKKD